MSRGELNSIPLTQEVRSVRFSFYTAEEIRKLSVKQITTLDSFDRLGNPVAGGTFDPAFGACDMKDICQTCSLNSNDCPGHFGHVELAVPVFHPASFGKVYTILQRFCWGCHQFMYDRNQVAALAQQFKLLDAGELEKAKAVRKKAKKTTYRKLAQLQEIVQFVDEESKEDGGDAQMKDADEASVDAEIDEILQAEYQPGAGKYTHIEMVREKWLKKFFASGVSFCPNCGLPPRKLRRERATSKVFLLKLTGKEQKYIKNNNLFYPGVLGAEYLDGDFTPEEDEEEEEYNPDDDNEEAKKKAKEKRIEKEKAKKSPGRLVTPVECKEHLRLLFENEQALVDMIFGEKRRGEDGKAQRKAEISMFFVDALGVLPPRFRPSSILGGKITFHAQNRNLDQIILANNRIASLAKTDRRPGARDPYIDSWTNLQKAVNQSYDSTLVQNITLQKTNTPGVKQILEKKEGLFRKNMMGKRVNFAARTVISPDCFLQTSEIGIPQYFAENLYFQQPVTQFNYKDMAQLVINGPQKYPGAMTVEDEFGARTNLSAIDEQKRIGLSKTLLTPSNNAPPGSVKKVYRHLMDGDMVLMNRQPTLHKPSMMAHKAKIIRSGDRVLRMHYANCATYNADFDGDEMNVHFPQSFLAQSEAKHIAATDFQYIVPRNGGPLRGLIQDYVVIGAMLTQRDTFFTREQFQELLYSSLFNVHSNKSIKIPPPAILKPKKLWTGKQVITTTLNHITMGRKPISVECGTKIPAKLWGTTKGDLMNDGIVMIKENELLCGVLDKNQFGASAFGVVHCAYELYGPETATTLLSTWSRLFVNHLNTQAFTCGIDDLLMMSDAEKTRRELLDSTNEIGRKVAAQFVGLEKYDKKEIDKLMGAKLKTDRENGRLDSLMKNKLHPVTSSVISACIPNGQVKKFPWNNFSMMTVSGAKGSQVNFSQVSCLLGQQELEGKRVPRMASGKTLPSFDSFDPTARAGGFIMDRFLTGIKPQEYFFHCMAGREGLIDTAVKTSRSGYLQRCLIKNLENLTVGYDYTVRDNSDNSVVQFYYGEDSLDVTKIGFMNNPKFSFFAQNYNILLQRFDLDKAAQVFAESGSESEQLWAQFYQDKEEEKGGKIYVEPLLANYAPGSHLGAVSDKFQSKLEEYIAKNPDGLLNADNSLLTDDVFRNLMWLKYQQCLVDPGEAVGLLAAQSVGEPSTQMTLNTFHLAGRGEANVTLGIPRLREIIMTASKEISTPMMEIVLKDPTDKAAAERFADYLQPIKLSEIVDNITTEESIDKATLTSRKYNITLNFVAKYEEILKKYSLSQKEFQVEVKKVANLVSREVRRAAKSGSVSVGQVQQKSGEDEGEGETEKKDEENKPSKKKKKSVDDDEEAGEEDGSTAEKAKKQKSEQTYDEDEEEKKAASDEEEEKEDADEEAEEAEEGEEDEKPTKDEFDTNLSKHSLSFNVRVPLESRKILMVSVVEKVLQKFYVKPSQGISRVFALESEKKGKNGEKLYSVQTEGVNFPRIWECADLVDVNAIASNHIYGVLRTYGVEAARALIMRECYSVFKVYDITVDWRHLGLIADFMTFAGGYRGMNRSTMNTSASPLQKMSYESCTRFLTDAAVNADIDPLNATAARIVLGGLVRSGTGAFSVGVRVEPTVVEH